MRCLPIAFILFLAGCTMAGKVQNEGTLAQQVKGDTSTSLTGVESYKGPAPNSVTYNVRVAKGGTCTLPTPAPVSVESVEVERKIEKALSDKIKARSSATWKITEADGFYWLLGGFALLLVCGGIAILMTAYVAWANFSNAGRAADGLANLVDTKLKILPRDGEAWANLQEVATKIDGYYNGLKSIWPWGK